MLYESDINSLFDKWETHLIDQSQDYKIAVRDCIYDLKCLIDKLDEEEALAHESFQESLKDSEGFWDEWFDSLISDGLFA